MATGVITPELKQKLETFLKKEKKVDLVTAYVFFLQERLHLKPVVFPMGKTIYRGAEEGAKLLEAEGKLWREGQVRISFSREAVNEETKRIYLCPFCHKVFGDNTHPNPQDAIYEHVAKCPDNTERMGGLKPKRFNVSEDPEMIKNYITERKAPITKTVYSSAITGKLFNSREAVVRDFKENYLTPISAIEALGQNRFEIEEHFLAFLQNQISEDKVGEFVEEMGEHKEFETHVSRWVG